MSDKVLAAVETPEQRAKRLIDAWVQDIADAVDSMHEYMRDVNRETKFMVDDFAFNANSSSIDLPRSSREPVVYEFIIASTGGQAGEVVIGNRRRIPVLANAVLSIPVKMRVYENDQITLTTGTLEAPGAAARLFLEFTGHIYPRVHP